MEAASETSNDTSRNDEVDTALRRMVLRMAGCEHLRGADQPPTRVDDGVCEGCVSAVWRSCQKRQHDRQT